MKTLRFRLLLKGKVVGYEAHNLRKGDQDTGMQIFHDGHNICEGNPGAYEPSKYWIKHDEKVLILGEATKGDTEVVMSELPTADEYLEHVKKVILDRLD